MATQPNPKPERGQWKIRYWTTKVEGDGTVRRVRRTKCLGPIHKMSFHEAQRQAILFLSLPATDQGSSDKTMADLIHCWRESVKPTLKLSTQRSYEWAFIRILPTFGKRPLGQLSRAEIQAFLTAAGRKLSGKSVRDLRCWLRALLSLAVEWQWIAVNPAAGRLRLPQAVPVRNKIILTPQQFWQLVDALQQPYSTILILAALSGLRKGEMEPLRWSDIGPGKITVDEAVYRGVLGTPKTRHSRRTVNIGTIVRAALEDWRELAKFTEPGDFVFGVSTNSPIDLHNAMTRHIRPACRRLGIPQVGWHDLRHTYATWGRAAGVPVETMRDQLGHASAVLTLDIYSHAGDDRDRAARAVERYANRVRKRNPRDPKTEPLSAKSDAEAA